ncbi:hypothetical protein QWZ16_03610 [Vibrio ostreicida]|uniref:Acetyltransferase n=1 Tax=Vibrio ostreicida TaxID=526588 RepID=A0ABT8BRU0_9VIBR|nr:hypothetical protein [Vibrio ostreicida]MDN3608830.1 hypothetical protein [Vibrio ostreicida]
MPLSALLRGAFCVFYPTKVEKSSRQHLATVINGPFYLSNTVDQGGGNGI